MKKRVIHARLEIKKKKCHYTFEHYNEHYIHVSEIRKRHEFSYDIDMAVMKPDSHYEMVVPWNWLVASAAGIGVTVGTITHLVFNLTLQKILMLSPFLLVTITFVFLSLRSFMQGYDRKRVFLSRYAAYPILQIPFDNKRNNKAYNFIAHLEHYTEMSINKRRIPDEVLQAGEMKTLRRLAEEGLISKSQYKTAKNRIFKNLDNIPA